MVDGKSNVIKAENISDDNAQIQGLIYIVRNKQVMLDKDLASLFQVETGALNRAVKRNEKRFPEEFMFQITENEYANLKCKFGISSSNEVNNITHGGRRTLPYAFTEQGIAMLSAVLRSDIAVQVSISIMKTFVEIRKYMANTSFLYNRISDVEKKQIMYQHEVDEKFGKVFEYISSREESSQKIFFDGQIYDAFSLLIDMVKGATSSIILIDNYIDINTLNILSKKEKGVDVLLYTSAKCRLNKMDIKMFNQQYPKLQIYYTSVFHDRFMIIDESRIYHIGESLKDAGRKCFGISLMKDTGVIQDIMQRLAIEMDD